MSDGRLMFNTKIDNSGVAKDLKDLERQIKRSQESISKFENAKMPLVKQAEALGVKLDAAKAKAARLKAELSSVQGHLAGGSDPAAYIGATARKAEIESALKANEKEVNVLQKEWDKVNDKVDDYDNKILKANNDIKRNTASAAELGKKLHSPGAKMEKTFQEVTKSTSKFSSQLLRIGTSMIMFRVFNSLLQGITTYMGQILRTNAEYTSQLAQLKGVLLTAFQPIYEFILPGLITVLRIITTIINALANVLSFFSGKTATQSAKNAKALNQQATALGGVADAAEEAKKQMMGFDEINKLESAETSAGSGGGAGTEAITPDFSGIKDMEDDLLKLLGIVSAIAAGLLTWKIASAFTDSLSLAAGLGLAVGGAFLYAFNWADAFANGLDWGNLSGMIAGMISLATGLGLAFGAVGAAVGLLIGSVGLIVAALVEFNRTGEVSDEMLVALAAGLVGLGAAIALLTGNPLPLIIGLILGIGTAFGITEDSIRSAVETALSWILTLWQSIQNFFDWLVGSWNNIWGSISNYQITGTIGDVSGWNMPETASADVPALASGAVLPANKPFLAMVGDQKNGTNIEAPLETIKQALAEVMAEYGGGDINIEFTGSLAELVRLLAPKITREQRRNTRAAGG